MAKQIALLGATGSIGRSTLDVVRQYPDRYEIHSLTAGSRVDELVRLCAQWQPKIAVIADESRYSELVEKLAAAGLSHVRAMAGSAALCEIVALPEVDVAVLAIVGAAGLAPTFAAAKAGKRLLLANKESVVCGGELLMGTVKECRAELLPVDSEHNAIYQCLAGATTEARANAR